MKALVKPNMHTHLARGGLSKHLQNSITHILRVENDKVEQPLQIMILQESAKYALLHLKKKDMNQLIFNGQRKILMRNQFVESIQLPFGNRVPKHKLWKAYHYRLRIVHQNTRYKISYPFRHLLCFKKTVR